MPCSLNTSPEHTICYSSPFDCPIIDIKFLPRESELVNKSNYTVLDFTDELFLAYSKVTTDNLPLTTTSVEASPCMVRSQLSDDASSTYILETRISTNGCKEIENLQVSHDDRFTDNGLKISEF